MSAPRNQAVLHGALGLGIVEQDGKKAPLMELDPLAAFEQVLNSLPTDEEWERRQAIVLTQAEYEWRERLYRLLDAGLPGRVAMAVWPDLSLVQRDAKVGRGIHWQHNVPSRHFVPTQDELANGLCSDRPEVREWVQRNWVPRMPVQGGAA